MFYECFLGVLILIRDFIVKKDLEEIIRGYRFLILNWFIY